ncbi:protein of unknown function [Nitrospira japonica]|uniref:TonB C-terminal domain-containing protein n=1 Tax=Nitrospira japonica TaxID=1325564 RepID=A0A1W1I590_9BACT|nr:protein of unknown function [Nitrospira japonica]
MILSVVVTNLGKISHTWLVQSSSHPILDQVVVDVVQSIAPISFKHHSNTPTKTIYVPMTFKMR